MKICRFQFGEMVSSGVLEGDHVVVFEDNRRKDEAFAFSDVKLLPPVAPSKIVCVDRNYAEHEGELAVVIGRRCKSLFDDEDAMRYVLGFMCLNDVTARDLQKKDGQFT